MFYHNFAKFDAKIDESYEVFGTLISKAIGHFLSRKTSILTINYINFKNKIFNK